MTKHWMAFALAGAMTLGSAGVMAQSADKSADKPVDNQNSVADPAKPNSGPGVQGPADTRTGPSTRAPDDGASTGAGDGSAGTGGSATTQPSQDSSGVEGQPGNKSGPAAKKPTE